MEILGRKGISMRTTSGPLATARRLTTGLVVAAAFGTGVVGAHLGASRVGTTSEGTSALGTSQDDGAAGQDDAGTGADDGAVPQRVPGFRAVQPLQPGVAAPHARTSGS